MIHSPIQILWMISVPAIMKSDVHLFGACRHCSVACRPRTSCYLCWELERPCWTHLCLGLFIVTSKRAPYAHWRGEMETECIKGLEGYGIIEPGLEHFTCTFLCRNLSSLQVWNFNLKLSFPKDHILYVSDANMQTSIMLIKLLGGIWSRVL
jgi:hypothetical protein